MLRHYGGGGGDILGFSVRAYLLGSRRQVVMRGWLTACLSAALLVGPAMADIRPKPLAVGKNASPVSAGAEPRFGGKTEGQVYLESLPAEERAVVLRDKIYLLPETSVDSPSAQQDGDSAAIRGFIRSVVIFEQPKQRVIKHMYQPNTLASFLPRLDRSQTVRRVGDEAELVKFTVEFLFWDIDFWIQHWFYPEISRYEWFLDTKNYENDIEANRGYWQVWALNDRETIGEYGVEVDTGIPIPRNMYKRIQRREIPEAMAAFKKFIDTDGQYRKDD